MAHRSSYVSPLIPEGPIRLGEAEYMELPNDGKRYQILEGDLDETPAPTLHHQKVAKRLYELLLAGLEASGKGEVYFAPVDVILDDHNIVQPDLLFVRSKNFEIMSPKNIRGAPDLIVEVLSESNRRTDVLTKSRIYARFGVPSYWIADPEIDRLDLYRLKGKKYQLAVSASRPAVVRPSEFPGLKIPLERVFG